MTDFELDITFKDYVEPCDFCNNAIEHGGTCDRKNGACKGFDEFLNFMEKWDKWKKMMEDGNLLIENGLIKYEIECPKCNHTFTRETDNIYTCPKCGHKWFSSQINPI